MTHESSILEMIRSAVPAAPRDLVAVYDEVEDLMILRGTAPDDETRLEIIHAALSVEGVYEVDDRMFPRF